MSIRRFFLVMLSLLTVVSSSQAVTRTPATPDAEAAASAESAAGDESTPKTDDVAEGQAPDAAPADAEAPAAPEVAAAPVEPPPAAKPAAARERLSAFSKGPLRFTSVGRVKAFMMKFDRNLQYTLKPIAKGGSVDAVEVTMVDRANGNKVTKGRLDVTPNGALRAHVTPLTNACNIGSIDPITRHKLMKSEESVVTRSQMEIQGKIHLLEVTHTREGDVGEDGSMRVKSESESTDGKVKLTTVTTLAPDGLPWLAETTGTIAKGPINLDVNLKLQREDVEEARTETGE